MKFLYVITHQSVADLYIALIKLGHEVDVVDGIEPDPTKPDEAHIPIIRAAIDKNTPDYVISYLFNPQISDITHEYGIPYISWTYDSPLTSLFNDSLNNDNNYTFIFDKAQCDRLKKSYHSKIFHFPLGANIDRIGKIDLKDEEISKWTSDVSFVGTLYDKNSYNDFIGYLDEYTKLQMKHYLLTNMCNWNATKPWPILSDYATSNIINTLNAASWNKTTMPDSEFLGILFLSRKLAEIDRITVLNSLAENFKVDLYTNKTENNNLSGVNIHGRVDYLTDMSKIFYCSKVNLNITLPSIETGIPQRIFDIMACGGFTLTNYQEEIDDLFKAGENIEVYHSIDELKDKIKYYLSHEKERVRIAMNGYYEIKNKHNHVKKVQEMLEIVKNN